MALAFAVIASPVLGSIQGTYSGKFLTGIQSVAGEGTGAYSYVHTSISAKKTANANYGQYAGGKVVFAMDNRDGISFSYNDADTNGALGVGDQIILDFTVDLLKFDGLLDSSNTLLDVVATLSLKGNLTVGGTAAVEHSSGFTNGIRNITSGDTASTFQGIDYTIAVTADFSIHSVDYKVGDEFTGDAFFQSGKLAGPFNGVSFDDATDPDKITFAIWGDSRNMNDSAGTSHNTGFYTKVGDQQASDPNHALGFDIFIEADKIPGPGTDEIVPEASSVMVWGLLSCMGLLFRRRQEVSC